MNKSEIIRTLSRSDFVATGFSRHLVESQQSGSMHHNIMVVVHLDEELTAEKCHQKQMKLLMSRPVYKIEVAQGLNLRYYGLWDEEKGRPNLE